MTMLDIKHINHYLTTTYKNQTPYLDFNTSDTHRSENVFHLVNRGRC